MKKLKNSLSIIAVLFSAGIFIYVLNEIENRFFLWFLPILLIAMWFLKRYSWSFLGAILFSIAAGEVDVVSEEKQLILWAIVICSAIQVLIAYFENVIQNRISPQQGISNPTLGRNTLFGFFGISIAYALINPSCPSVVVSSKLIATLPTKLLEHIPLIEVYVNSTYCLGNTFLTPIIGLLSSSGIDSAQGNLVSSNPLISVLTGMWPLFLTSLFAAVSQTLPPNFSLSRMLIQTLKAVVGMISISFAIIFIMSIVGLMGSGLFTIYMSAVRDQPEFQLDLLFRIIDFGIIISFAICILLFAFGAGWGARWWIHKWKPVDQGSEEEDDISNLDENIGSEITSDTKLG